MKYSVSHLSAGALVLASASLVQGQYAPPPSPAPFQGFLNEWLRKDDPYMNKWDFGGSVRIFRLAGALRQCAAQSFENQDGAT